MSQGDFTTVKQFACETDANSAITHHFASVIMFNKRV